MTRPTEIVVACLFVFVGLGAAVWLFMPDRRDRFDEFSVRRSLLDIHIAQDSYAFSHPELGFACSLHALRSDTKDLGSMSKDVVDGQSDGYLFYISECTQQGERTTKYKAIAVPITVRKGSERGYCIDQSGVIHYDPKGGSQCTKLMR